MPGYSIPIKARMLYSSCKAPLLDALESVFNIRIDKKVMRLYAYSFDFFFYSYFLQSAETTNTAC